MKQGLATFRRCRRRRRLRGENTGGGSSSLSRVSHERVEWFIDSRIGADLGGHKPANWSNIDIMQARER